MSIRRIAELGVEEIKSHKGYGPSSAQCNVCSDFHKMKIIFLQRAGNLAL